MEIAFSLFLLLASQMQLCLKLFFPFTDSPIPTLSNVPYPGKEFYNSVRLVMQGTWKPQEQTNRLTEEVHTQDENMDGDCYERLGAMLPRSCQARNVPFIIRMGR